MMVDAVSLSVVIRLNCTIIEAGMLTAVANAY